MSRENLITVIVPVHNGEKYLEGCIESIQTQTYRELEIIVVNDGSTDGTAQVCERLQEKYSDISVITMPDLGVAAARNRAIDQSKGAYITFVDADDRLRDDMLQKLYDAIQTTGSDVAGCRFCEWSSEKEWQAFLKNPNTDKRYASYNSKFYLRGSILRGNCRCWSKLYRRELIGEVRFREELTVGEDMLFLIDLLPGITNAVELEYAGYGYYQNPAGVMRRPFSPAYMDQIRCWELAQDKILKIDSRLQVQINAKIMTGVMLTVGKIAQLPANERKEAARYLDICKEKLAAARTTLKFSTVYMPEGYNMKVRLFSATPELYVRMYHILHPSRRTKRP